MLIELTPLLLLFEFSLILARWVGTPAERERTATTEPEPPGTPAS
jgi:Sec-independent protein secretion pathway component TatC